MRATIKNIVTMLALSALVFSSVPAVPSFADELDDAAAKLEEAKNAAQEAQERKEAADAAVEETQARIDELEAIIPVQQEQSATVMRSMYKQGGSDFLSLFDAIVNAGTLSEMLRNIDSWSTISEYRQNALMESKSSRDELSAQRESLVAEQEEAAKALEDANAKKKEAQSAYNKAQTAASAVSFGDTGWTEAAGAGGGIITLSQMKFRGVVHYAGYRYTYYSQSVLPGHGLRIPGRHVQSGCVVDGDGYICVASSTHSKGTIVPTPLVEFPLGKVYDCGCARGTIDLYIA